MAELSDIERNHHHGGGPAANRELFEYWLLGLDDARIGLPPLRWLKQGWPEDGRDAYLEGHVVGEARRSQKEGEDDR